MPERELIAAKAKAERSKADLQATIAELKQRLKPARLASDAWHGVKEKGSDYAGKGVHAVSGHPAAVGGTAAALALFLFRGPLANLLSRLFGSGRAVQGRVTADLSKADNDYDLTAPVVVPNEGVKA